MANLNESSSFDANVVSLDYTDAVEGAANPSVDPNTGAANDPHVSLANRTQYLNDGKFDKSGGILTGDLQINPPNQLWIDEVRGTISGFVTIITDLKVNSPYAVYTDDIKEKSSGHGVEIDGATINDGDYSGGNINSTGEISVDNIVENTLNAGVTIDGILLKDGYIKTGNDTKNLPFKIAKFAGTTASSGTTNIDITSVMADSSKIISTSAFIDNGGGVYYAPGCTSAGLHYSVSKGGNYVTFENVGASLQGQAYILTVIYTD